MFTVEKLKYGEMFFDNIEINSVMKILVILRLKSRNSLDFKTEAVCVCVCVLFYINAMSSDYPLCFLKIA